MGNNVGDMMCSDRSIDDRMCHVPGESELDAFMLLAVGDFDTQQKKPLPPSAIKPDARMTAPPSRLVPSLTSFEDLAGELNLFELNSLVKEHYDQRAPFLKRLKRWAEYYYHPDHRGEIYDIMDGIVLPWLKEALKNEPFTDINIVGSRSDHISGGADIHINATVLKIDQGTGAGSYAPRELVRSLEKITILSYDAHTAELTSAETSMERSGVTTSVDFGLDDLINLPKLVFGLLKFGAKVLPKVLPKIIKPLGKLALKPLLKAASGLTGRLSKQELATLKGGLSQLGSVSVELGPLAGKKFAAITGLEACRQLFANKLSDLSRLAKHWPQELAQKFKVEIQSLIMDRMKHTKIAQELANAFAANKVNSELLNRLPKSLRGEIKDVVKKRWNSIRETFWGNVYDDEGLMAELKKVGLTFKNRTNAPVLEIGGQKLKITLDHIGRKVENPLEAFDHKNLRAATALDNSAAKEKLVRNIKELTGLNLDEFNALGRQAERLPKELAEALGNAIDASPTDDDLFRGLGWAE